MSYSRILCNLSERSKSIIKYGTIGLGVGGIIGYGVGNLIIYILSSEDTIACMYEAAKVAGCEIYVIQQGRNHVHKHHCPNKITEKNYIEKKSLCITSSELANSSRNRWIIGITTGLCGVLGLFGGVCYGYKKTLPINNAAEPLAVPLVLNNV
jgi:hypothetical protein